MLELQGSCNKCGKCCLSPVVVDNACTTLENGKCDFYVDTLNDEKYGHCLILGRGGNPIKNVEDRENNLITAEEIAWFEENCTDYPLFDDIMKGHIPPKECGFYLGLA